MSEIQVVEPLRMLGMGSRNKRIYIVLLPVKPPEVISYLVVRCQSMIKESLHILPVGCIKKRCPVLFRIHTEGFHEIRIYSLMRSDTVGRMIIHGHSNAVALKFCKEFLRILEILRVPCIAGPAFPAAVT